MGACVGVRGSRIKNIVEELAATKNISAGGLLFIVGDKLAVGAILEIKIQLPNSEALIECLARVVRVEELKDGQEYDIAVCFLDLTGAERIRLDKFVGGEIGGRVKINDKL